MKNIVFFVVSMLLVLMLGLTSCMHNAEKLIVGKWKIVSLFVDGEDWSIAREVSGDVPSGAPQFNATCSFKENGTCTVCVINNSLFLDGKYLIDDVEFRIIDLSSDWGDIEEEKYDIRLNIEKITKETLMGNGSFEIRDRNTMKIIDGYAIKITLEKV